MSKHKNYYCADFISLEAKTLIEISDNAYTKALVKYI